jgi:hypothetical protein
MRSTLFRPGKARQPGSFGDRQNPVGFAIFASAAMQVNLGDPS